jgi:phosphatidylserine decarboxylase
LVRPPLIARFDLARAATYILATEPARVSMPEHLKPLLVPIHRAGWPFIGIGLALAVALGFVAQPLFWLGLIVTAWVAWFFRDPARMVPQGDELVVSPADGRVVAVAPRVPPVELELGAEPRMCVSVFLSIFDVHVTRAPVAGRLARVAYCPGKFVNAVLDKASHENERQSLRIETTQGESFGLVLIAGLVARRIVRCVEESQDVAAGERVALIRFGSRCDVYLPDGMSPRVVIGQRATAGETILADGRRNQPPLVGRAI